MFFFSHLETPWLFQFHASLNNHSVSVSVRPITCPNVALWKMRSRIFFSHDTKQTRGRWTIFSSLVEAAEQIFIRPFLGFLFSCVSSTENFFSFSVFWVRTANKWKLINTIVHVYYDRFQYFCRAPIFLFSFVNLFPLFTSIAKPFTFL